jgi:hypothetical protein
VNFITNSGTIGGTYADSSHVRHGFIFDGTTYTTLLDYPGSRQFSDSIGPVGIGPGGEVVGNWNG